MVSTVARSPRGILPVGAAARRAIHCTTGTSGPALALGRVSTERLM